MWMGQKGKEEDEPSRGRRIDWETDEALEIPSEKAAWGQQMVWKDDVIAKCDSPGRNLPTTGLTLRE